MIQQRGYFIKEMKDKMIIELNKEDKTFKIKSKICLMCGHKFSKEKGKEDLHLSDHHAIPGKMNPVFNVVIPIHIKCHRKLNNTFLVKQEFIKMEHKIESLHADFLRIKKGEGILSSK